MEDYIWGRIDEADYLRNIVANDLIDEEQLLPKLNAIQQNLNIQLRQGVGFFKDYFFSKLEFFSYLFDFYYVLKEYLWEGD